LIAWKPVTTAHLPESRWNSRSMLLLVPEHDDGLSRIARRVELADDRQRGRSNRTGSARVPYTRRAQREPDAVGK
jgi:hypothetical protein